MSFGLYVDPPTHAIVLSVDEKSQIQALDRTQPGLPLKKGRAGTMTHDYTAARNDDAFCRAETFWTARSSVANMQAAIGHQEFIRFLNAVEAEVSCEQGGSCDPSTTTQHTSIQRSANGSTAMSGFTFHFHANLVLMAKRCRGVLRHGSRNGD